MAEELREELSAEEAERLSSVEHNQDALASLIDDLSGNGRRKRQLAARVVNLVAQREPELLAPYLPDLIDALYRPEAQTRWEILGLRGRRGSPVRRAFGHFAPVGVPPAVLLGRDRARPLQEGVADPR